MSSRSRVVPFLVTLVAAAPLTGLPQTPTSGAAGSYVPAKPIERLAPDYPEKELRARSEGWVMVSFVVAPTGKVVDAMVEDSSGNTAIEEAALKGVMRWRFEPALLNGHAVESGITRTRISMALDYSDGASWDFRKKYREFVTFIDAHDHASAERLLLQLEHLPHINLYEDAWLWWSRYLYLDAVQSTDDSAKLAALERALGHEIDYLEPNLLVEAARRIYLMYAENLDLSSAIKTFERLRDSKVAQRSRFHQPVMAALKPSYDTMIAAAHGEQLLRTNAEISRHHYWVHYILRRSFSIDGIAGRLDTIDIRCARGMKRYPAVVEKIIWSVPADWGDCGVYVSGEPGAKFVFQE